ncbi:SEL1-like repeat protein [Aeromonas media]|uniref:SEL1-like repeat protein n=1 Tax=Aeromonas media TaxID=651 RepID=UPI003D1573CF
MVQKHAIQEYGEAQLALGKMHLSGSGVGVPQDDELRYYWLSKAAAQGKREKGKGKHYCNNGK